VTDGKTLRSFSVNPGGYINYFDPKLGEDGEDTDFSAPDDKLAQETFGFETQYGSWTRPSRRLLGGAADV